MSVREVIDGLRRPEAYGRDASVPVECRQTHISLLFFVDDRVYKVLKPVDMGFLDYRELGARRFFCEEGLRLNRRLAPETYLAVLPVTRAGDGRLRMGGDGDAVDWAVEMRRLPEDRMMSALLDADAIEHPDLDDLADLLVDFHARCPTGPGVDEHSEPASLRRQSDENMDRIAGFASTDGEASTGVRALSTALYERVRASADRFLGANEPLLRRRVRAGRIREGHGDLHAEHVCLTDRGIVIYDCIEFSRRFRCRDVAAEIAYLAMDLDMRGRRDLATFFVNAYGQRAGDRDLDVLGSYYRRHFACIRGLVTALKAVEDEVGADERASALRESMRYFHLAASYTLPPAVILMCGLPAVGKSWAAQAIAAPFGAEIVRSDVVRKSLAGMLPLDRPEGEAAARLYAPAFTRQTYAALHDRAHAARRAGRTVVVDATFSTAEARAAFADLDPVVVECVADEGTVRRRLDDRATDAAEPSDAGLRAYLEMRETFEPPREIAPGRHVRVAAGLSHEEIAAAVIDRLITSG